MSVWDAASLIVGIVIGTTIFKSPGFIAGNTSSPAELLGFWAIGGVLAFIGALCYAELGAAYGGQGGDYYYLTRAFGPWAGFLFGWTQLVVIQSVNIAMFASVFAEYAWKLIGPHAAAPADITTAPLELVITASGIVVLLTAVNLIGLRFGKVTQNLLTLAKLGGLSLLVLAALFGSQDSAAPAEIKTSGTWTTALIMILYAYGGWNDAAFVATEVRDRQRNVPRALLWGVGLITLTYLIINASYLAVLGFAGLQQSPDPPVDLVTSWWGAAGGRIISVLIMVSALGAVNGLILSVSRLHAAVGSDHRLFSFMARWGSRHDAPIGSLVVQAVITIVLLGLVGTPGGQSLLSAAFEQVTGQPLPWKKYSSFDLLFTVGAPVFWTFFLATGLAFFVLRWREPHLNRPFRTPLFPLTPLLFCGMCGFGIWASASYAGPFTWLGVLPVGLGFVVYAVERIWLGKPPESH